MLCQPMRNRAGADDPQCARCGRHWEPQEGIPVCRVGDDRKARRERTRAVAERELAKIREVLKG